MKYFSRFCFALILVLSVAYGTTLAVPANPYPVQVTQPDGTKLEIVQHGDEWANFLSRKDNQCLIEKNSNGYWEYLVPASASKGLSGTASPILSGIKADKAPPSNSIKASDYSKSSQFNTQKSQKAQQSVQNSSSFTYPAHRNTPEKLIVILVNFQDRQITDAANAQTRWKDKIFGATNSVNQFYRENSNGKFYFEQIKLGSNDTGVYSVTLDYNHPNTGEDTNAANGKLVADSIIALRAQNVNLENYDVNKNGILLASEIHILCIVAGYETAYYPSPSPSVWAHKSGGRDAGNGINVFEYSQFGEIQGDHEATIGVICHELAHDLGCPDLYNTSNQSDPQTPGIYSLMDAGSWAYVGSNYSGSSPAHMDPWDKSMLGYYSSASTTSLFPASDSANYSFLRINIPDTNQYFLVENRQKSGFDSGLRNSGIVVWRIDDGIILNNMFPNNNARKGLKIVSVSPHSAGSNVTAAETTFYSSTNNSIATESQSNITMAVTAGTAGSDLTVTVTGGSLYVGDGTDVESVEVTDGVLVNSDIAGVSIDLESEKFRTSSEFSIGAYSIDGGTKWKKGSPAVNGSLTKFLNKGGKLIIAASYNAKTKTIMGPVATFPQIEERPKAPKLTVNYAAAHLSNNILQYSTSSPLWALTDKESSTMVSDGLQLGLSTDKKTVSTWKTMPLNGVEMLELPSTGKAVKTVYFYRTTPLNVGKNIPASKPVKINVSSLAPAKALKVDYKKEVLKGVDHLALDFLSDCLTKETAKTPIVISTIIDKGSFKYWIVPSAKKPGTPVITFTLLKRAQLDDVSANGTNGKYKADKKYEFLAEEKWGGLKKITSACIIPTRIKATGKSSEKPTYSNGKWVLNNTTGLAASALGEMTVTWGAYAEGKEGITSIAIGSKTSILLAPEIK